MSLPPIPGKRYFTIGEVSDLCGVKPYVLRYWEQEFTQLKPSKRRGNRRYYQHHEVLLIRRIRNLLYEQGFTINGARNKLVSGHEQDAPVEVELAATASSSVEQTFIQEEDLVDRLSGVSVIEGRQVTIAEVRKELDNVLRILGS